MPWPVLIPRRPVAMPKWMIDAAEQVDWERTGALLGAITAAAFIIRALFRPLWEKMIVSAITEHLKDLEKVIAKAETNADRLEGLEAATLAQGKVLADIPRMTDTMDSLCKTLDRLDGTMKGIDEHVQGLQRFQSRVEGMWEGEERRRSQEPHHPKRRQDDR